MGIISNSLTYLQKINKVNNGITVVCTHLISSNKFVFFRVTWLGSSRDRARYMRHSKKYSLNLIVTSLVTKECTTKQRLTYQLIESLVMHNLSEHEPLIFNKRWGLFLSKIRAIYRHDKKSMLIFNFQFSEVTTFRIFQSSNFWIFKYQHSNSWNFQIYEPSNFRSLIIFKNFDLICNHTVTVPGQVGLEKYPQSRWHGVDF